MIFAVLTAAGRASEAGLTAELVVDAPPFIFAAPTAAAAETTDAALRAQGFQDGIGLGRPASGRFGGRGRSDGVLDWDCLEFGLIEKGYLAAHPQNVGQRRWAVRFSPLDTAKKSTNTAGDDFRVTWMSVAWQSRFAPTPGAPGRRAGETIAVRTTYSLATPGMLIETDEHALHFDLSETSGYRFAVLPLRGGATLRALSAHEPVYQRMRDGDLADNWILLWGALAFPDVPLLLVLKEQPAEIALRGSTLELGGARPLGHVVLATPYGMRAFAPAETAILERLRDGVARSRFWSKALLGFITDSTERFKVDEAAGTVTVHQRFTYRDLGDAWGSKPLHLAPLPPVLALAARVGPALRLAADAVDLGFPTRHGPLRAAVGRDECSYTLPIPPAESRTPLAAVGASPAREAVRAHHVQRAHDGSRPPLPGEFPGLWSRPDRPIVDSTAWLNEIAFLWPQLDAASRRALKSNARSVLFDSLDDDARFKETELYQSIERGPDRMRGGVVRPIWFDRTEPVTGTTYALSYTVPNIRKEGRSVTDFTGTFTDCEWGNGLGLWGIYQLARLSGDWETVKRNWKLVGKIYALFEVQQDWAAMTASGSERGRRWTDTSCYGGYVAYREMARRIGAADDWHRSVYLQARHAMLRLALLEFGVWSSDLYGFPPFRVAHLMQEHNRGFKDPLEPRQYVTDADFRGAPVASARRTFYSLVAEGTGYECPDLLYRLAPAVTAEIVGGYRRNYPEWDTEPFVVALNTEHLPAGGITIYEMLLFQLRDPGIPTAEIRARLVASGGLELIRQHLSQRGYYGRFGAAPEFVQALLETRDDPAWLIEWEGADLRSADFDRAANEAILDIAGESAWSVTLGGRAPIEVHWNGQAIPTGATGWQRELEHTVVRGRGAGLLRVRY